MQFAFLSFWIHFVGVYFDWFTCVLWCFDSVGFTLVCLGVDCLLILVVARL